jgi:tetratricopeptide (TPR) repeat protein
MKRVWCVAGLVLCLAGCIATEKDELARTYNEDGVDLFQHGDFGHARESFQAALAIHPDDAALLYNLGECYDRLGNMAQAESSYNQCLTRAPNHAACRHSLAVLLVRAHRGDEATRMVQDWLAHQPKLAAAYAEDGWLWRQLGDLPRAQARLHQALDLDPHEPRALIELALVYEAMDRPARALVLYERVLSQDPHQAFVVKRINALQAQGAGRPHPE